MKKRTTRDPAARERKTEYMRQWRAENREAYNRYQRLYKRRMRRKQRD